MVLILEEKTKITLVWKPFEEPQLVRVNVKINWKSHVLSKGAPTSIFPLKMNFWKLVFFMENIILKVVLWTNTSVTPICDSRENITLREVIWGT